MKHSVIVFGFLFVGIGNLFSQSEFRNGYIIKNNNDTIYGLIDYKGNNANSKKCIFKIDDHSEKLEYTPVNLKAYRFIDSKYYISKQINLENSNDNLFLEYLVNGIVDIFYYRDGINDHYFIDNGDGKLYELKNDEREFTVDYMKYSRKSKEYVGVLKASFRKSPSIAQKVDNINLDHKSLIKITHDYHNEICSDEECIIYEKRLPKLKIKFGPLTGMNFLSITENSIFLDELYYSNNAEFSNDIYPSIGLFLKINMPKFNEKFYFQYEVTYNSMIFGVSSFYQDPVYYQDYLYTIKLSQNALSNTGMIKYEFSNWKVRPTFQFGGFANKIFRINYLHTLDVRYSSGTLFYKKQSTINPFSTIEYGFNFGFGLISEIFKNKEIFIDLRFSKGFIDKSFQNGFGIQHSLNMNILSVNLGFQI